MNTLIHLRLSDNDFYFEKDIIVKNDNELLFDIIINESRKVLKEYKDIIPIKKDPKRGLFDVEYSPPLHGAYLKGERGIAFGECGLPIMKSLALGRVLCFALIELSSEIEPNYHQVDVDQCFGDFPPFDLLEDGTHYECKCQQDRNDGFYFE